MEDYRATIPAFSPVIPAKAGIQRPANVAVLAGARDTPERASRLSIWQIRAPGSAGVPARRAARKRGAPSP